MGFEILGLETQIFRKKILYTDVRLKTPYSLYSSKLCSKISSQANVRLESRGGHSHTLPIRVCAAQRGRDFEAPGLERGIHFRGLS